LGEFFILGSFFNYRSNPNFLGYFFHGKGSALI
jgi:hypothetical protein